MKFLSIAVVISTSLFLTSCSLGHMQVYTAGPLKQYPANEHDGSSFEKGILLTQTDKKAAYAAEEAWVNNKYPGNRGYNRFLVYRNEFPFDRLAIKAADGSTALVYFDASGFIKKKS
jgi:hypothetical protein